MEWDAQQFLERLKAGKFDGHLHDELGTLTPEQVEAVVRLLKLDAGSDLDTDAAIDG